MAPVKSYPLASETDLGLGVGVDLLAVNRSSTECDAAEALASSTALDRVNQRRALALAISPRVYAPKARHSYPALVKMLDAFCDKTVDMLAEQGKAARFFVYTANERKIEEALLLLEKGGLVRAREVLGEVLRDAPWLPGLRPALRAFRAAGVAPGLAGRPPLLLGRARAYGKGVLKGPVSIVNLGGTLHVSDFLGGAVYRFDDRGRFLGEVEPRFSGPLGMFAQGEERLWVCDFPARELVALDLAGTVVDRLDASKMAGGGKVRHPAYGSCSGQDMILLMRDETHRRGELLRLDLARRGRGARVIAPGTLGVPGDCCRFAGRTLVSGCYDRVLFEVDADGAGLVQLPTPVLEREVRWLCPVGDVLFVTAGASMYALDATLRVIFRADLEHMLGKRGVVPHGIAAIGDGPELRLHVVDFKRAIVQILKV